MTRLGRFQLVDDDAGRSGQLHRGADFYDPSFVGDRTDRTDAMDRVGIVLA